jgi:hypothetical protein
VLRRGVASAVAALAIGLGAWGAAGAAARVPSSTSPPVLARCGYGSPHSTPGGVKCLGPGEYCSHKPGYASAYHRAGFRCSASGRLEYD